MSEVRGKKFKRLQYRVKQRNSILFTCVTEKCMWCIVRVNVQVFLFSFLHNVCLVIRRSGREQRKIRYSAIITIIFASDKIFLLYIAFQHIILTFGHLSSLLTMRWAPSIWFKRRQENFFFFSAVCSRRKEEVHKNTFFRHLAIIIDNTHLVFIKFLRAKRKCWNIKLWLHCLLLSLSLT